MPTQTAPNLLPIALTYAAAGRAVFPIAPGTKWPSLPSLDGHADIPWKRLYGEASPDEATLRRWFTPTRLLGLSIACGATSGITVDGVVYGLEALDVDDAALWQDFLEACRFAGLDTLLKRLVLERSPRGSGHAAYATSVIQGNLTLARRCDPVTGELHTLIETRGEGGQLVIAPTPAGIHPDHPEHGYVLLQGSWETLPLLTAEERQALLDVARSFNEYVEPEAVWQPAFAPSLNGTGTRPGDKLNALADAAWWQSLLETHGWTLLHTRGAIQYWQRPGKQGRGCSATLGACGPYLYVFSSNAAPFDADHAYAPFAAYTLLAHGGDFVASAKMLAPQYRDVFLVDAPTMPRAAVPALDPSGWQATPPPPAKVALRLPGLMLGKGKEAGPLANIHNVLLALHHHPQWHQVFWWDEVRCRPMLDTHEVTDDDILDIADWLGTTLDISITGAGFRMIEQCVYKVCRETRRDLLQEWLAGLPPWDHVPRLDTWLCDIAGVPCNAYGCLVSRMLPLAMVARARDPGCITREVVIFEGPERSGKSELVRRLGGPEWSTILSTTLDTKESHMLLQGAWIAEMAELDSLSATRETRLKSYITMRDDIWIPKFSNMKIQRLRRTVFVGTTNETSSFKGQTGNTRYLPIKTTGQIALDHFDACRLQLFAEALAVYSATRDTWWHRSEEAEMQAQEIREIRREASVYEDALRDWLQTKPSTITLSWQDIAEQFLKIDREKWKDQMLQRQIAAAMRALHWEQSVTKDPQRKSVRRWKCQDVPF